MICDLRDEEVIRSLTGQVDQSTRNHINTVAVIRQSELGAVEEIPQTFPLVAGSEARRDERMSKPHGSGGEGVHDVWVHL